MSLNLSERSNDLVATSALSLDGLDAAQGFWRRVR